VVVKRGEGNVFVVFNKRRNILDAVVVVVVVVIVLLIN
jgi:hypothetical protein